jgi:hypothetical protein
MTHRSIASKFLASTLAGLLGLPAVLAGSVALLSPSVANAAVTSASCRIHAIEATVEGDGSIPPELEFMADQLKTGAFAQFKGIRFIEAVDYKLEAGVAVDKKFKSGHNVKLSLLGGDKEKLELQTEIQRGGTSVFKLEWAMKVAGLMLIPVSRASRSDQATIFAIQCK